MKHYVSIKNRDNTSQWQSCNIFESEPTPERLQMLADLTGRSVTHQKTHKGGFTERYYRPQNERYEENKQLISDIINGVL